MIGNILVPLDGSELAEHAIPYAERLARATGATLHLVSVVNALSEMAWFSVPPDLPARLAAEAQEERGGYLAQARARLASGLTAQTSVVDTTLDVTTALLEIERESGIDLVVMGTHGRSGVRHWALGSVAERLLLHGTLPIVLVRAQHRPITDGNRMEHVVIPLDGSTQAEAVVPVVAGLAGTLVRKATLVQVIGDSSQQSEAARYLESIAARLAEVPLQSEYRVVQGDPAEQIIEVAGANTLVAMTTHGHGHVLTWPMGAVAGRVLRHGAAPVLLLRTRRRATAADPGEHR